MSYIGNPIVSTDFPVDTFSGNGSTTAFTLTQAPASVNAIIVAVSGVLQEPSTYTISGTTLTFTAAPPSGTSNISVRHLGVTGIPNTPASGSVQYSSLNSSLQGTLVGRNRIINGAMVIDQRNAGASVTPTDTQYTLDRWRSIVSASSKFSIQRSTVAPTGFSNSLLITSLSAYTLSSSDVFGVFQRIEGFNCSDLMYGTANAKTVTVSFWVRSSLTGTFSGFLNNQGFDRAYPFSYTISAANTWEQKSVTIAGDTTGTWGTGSDGCIGLGFSIGSGSNFTATAGAWTSGNRLAATGQTSVVGTNGATFYITGVQLEVGSTATSFDYRPYGTELALCQRYYQKTYDVGTVAGSTFNWEYNSPVLAVGTGNFGLPCGRSFLVPMRTSPTLTTYDGDGNAGKIAVWSVGTNQSYASVNVSQNQILAFNFGNNTTLGRSYLFAYTASAEL
jgi:hypothetical protein